MLHAGSHLGAGFDGCLGQVAPALRRRARSDYRHGVRDRMSDPRREHRRCRRDPRTKPRRAGPSPGGDGGPDRHRDLPRHPAHVGGRDPLPASLEEADALVAAVDRYDRPGPPAVPTRERLDGPLRRPPRPPRQHRRRDDRPAARWAACSATPASTGCRRSWRCLARARVPGRRTWPRSGMPTGSAWASADERSAERFASAVSCVGGRVRRS